MRSSAPSTARPDRRRASSALSLQMGGSRITPSPGGVGATPPSLSLPQLRPPVVVVGQYHSLRSPATERDGSYREAVVQWAPISECQVWRAQCVGQARSRREVGEIQKLVNVPSTYGTVRHQRKGKEEAEAILTPGETRDTIKEP